MGELNFGPRSRATHGRMPVLAGSVAFHLAAMWLLGRQMPEPPVPGPQAKALTLIDLSVRPDPVADLPSRPQPVPRARPVASQASTQAVAPADAIVAVLPNRDASVVPATLAPSSASPPAPLSPLSPAAADHAAPRGAASHQAPRAAGADAAVSWEARLMAHLDKHKRYPLSARARRAQGVASIRFRVDRAGAVTAVSLQQSSGHIVLDRAALSTIDRAAPLPPFPGDRGDAIFVTVPITFQVR